MLKSILSFLLLLQAASAMEIQVHNMTCNQMPIAVEFKKICTDESICTIGKYENLAGTLSYNYLMEKYNMNQYSKVYLDLNMSLYGRDAAAQNFYVHKPAYEGTFLDFLEVPVCSNNTMTALDEDSECPSTGQYQFSTGLKLPHPDNAFQTWMYTGYDGLVKLGIYRSEEYGSDLLGFCTLYISTEQEKTRLGNLPNGKPVHEGIIAFLAVFLWLLALAFCCFTRRLKNKQVESEQVQKVPPLSPPSIAPEDKVEGRFKRLEEETQEEQNQNFAFRYVPTDGMRYVPPEDEPTPPHPLERIMCIA